MSDNDLLFRLEHIQKGLFEISERHWALAVQDARAEIVKLRNELAANAIQVETMRTETIEECAKIADRLNVNDVEYAARYPDEAEKYDRYAHRASVVAALIRGLNKTPLSSEQSDVMRAASEAATKVASWSPSKQDYAARIVGQQKPTEQMRELANKIETHLKFGVVGSEYALSEDEQQLIIWRLRGER